MRLLALSLLTLVWGLSLVPAAWLMAHSRLFLATTPGQASSLALRVVVVGIWLYPLTVLVSTGLAWRHREPFLALAPVGHLALLLTLVAAVGTFGP